jgi:signal transduction histidine kinase
VEQPAATVVGQHCSEILGLHRGERALDCSHRCGILTEIGDQAAELGCELWRLLPDGRRQPLLCNAAAVASSSGDPEIVHSLRDVTRLKEAEEAKTLFLATASHELKTPLTVINGFAETLARFDDIDDRTKLAALEAIRVRSGELSRIVDRLLMSSRIEAGRINLSVSTFEVVPLLRTRVEAFSTATGRAARFEAPSSASVLGNEDALVTVIDHLLDNAVKYSPGGEPVNVEVANEIDSVHVSVSDRGVGMDSEQVAHCFDKFWQAESSDVRRFGGTGIGLYIVQSLVEAMGGTVSVRSARGQGSMFTVALRPDAQRVDGSAGESTSIREFMRQIGVPERTRS